MNAPPFLPVVLSTLMILVAGYAAWRLASARLLELTTDVETDILLLVAGVAGAGLVSNWAHTLPRDAWSALFAIAACYFVLRAWLARADRPRSGRLIAHAAGTCVLVYMFLAGVAPSTIHGSTAGEYTMAGMPGMSVDTTITYPALGLVCVAAIALYSATAISKLSPASLSSAPGSPSQVPSVFAPRSVELSRIFLAVGFAYAILSKLV